MHRDAPRILIVDDDPDLVSLFREVLAEEGYVVDGAADGPSGLSALRVREPDLVLLDITLARPRPLRPGALVRDAMDGLEVLRRIRLRSSVPVMMVSGTDSELVRVVALKLGADDFLTKPVDLRELPLRVAAVLRRAREGTAALDAHERTVHLRVHFAGEGRR